MAVKHTPRRRTVVEAQPERATLVYSPHPLLAGADRQVFHTPFKRGETVAGYLRRCGVRVRARDVLLRVNDETIAPERWAQVRPHSGDTITVRAVVQGGGQRDGEQLQESYAQDPNKTTRLVLTIAILTLAPYTAGLLGLGAGTWGYAVYTSLFMVGGMYLINKAYPIPEPLKNQKDGGSPTYELSGGGNRGRAFEPLPLVIGKNRMFPDLGARAYTEFVGSDQYLYQVFNYGLSDVILSDHRLGDTSSVTYDGLTLQESGADGKVDLFPGNVDQLGVGVALAFETPIIKTSSAGTTRLTIELAGYCWGTSRGNGREVLVPGLAYMRLEYRALGAVDWLGFAPPNTFFETHGFPHVISLSTSATRGPQRWAFTKEVTSGQYEIRVAVAVEQFHNPPYFVTQIVWAQLLSFQPDAGAYTGQKRVALRIRASAQLSGQVDRFNSIVSAKTNVWNGSAWVVGETSNPAWWFLHLARGKKDAAGRRLFGAALPDARIDIEQLKAWGAWCDAKSLTCNLVFDRAMSVQQMLAIVARCGRAAPTWGNGKLGVVYDQADQPAVAQFGMANIVRHSFAVDYVTGGLADEIVVEFINPNLNWQPDTVRAMVPGATYPTNPVHIQLFGCADASMAGREANLIAAEQVYRRRQIRWETDIEGLVVQRGDVAILSHDLTQWGYSGRLVSGTTTQLVLDRAVPFTPALQHYIGVRFPDGSYNVYNVIYQAGESDTLTLDAATPLPSAPSADASSPPQDYVWYFEPKATPGKKVKIVDIQPVSEHRVKISATDEDPNYYLAEFNTYSHVATSAGLRVPTVAKVEVADTLIQSGNGFAVQVAVVWDVTGEYGGATVRAGTIDPSTGAYVLEEKGRTLGRQLEFVAAPSGQLHIEVTAFNLVGKFGDASKLAVNYTVVGKARPPQEVAALTFTMREDGGLLNWNAVPDVDLLEYEIRTGATFAAALVMDNPRTTQKNIGFLPAGTTTYWLRAKDSSGNYSTTPTSVAAIINAPAAPAVSNRFEGGDLLLEWAAPTSTQPIIAYEIRYGASFAGGAAVDKISARALRIKVAWSGTRQFWIAAVDAAGNVGSAALVDAVIAVPAAPSVSVQVIDNNVLLRWTVPAATLPIIKYELRKGATFAGAEVKGSTDSTFKAFFEDVSGNYIYWVVAIDSAGNYGTETSVAARVDQPPDFVLRADWKSTWTGTKTNALVEDDGDLLVPVVTTETFEQHFTNHAWTSPQDQVNAGFSRFMMPSTTGAVYEEIFDYGAVVPSTLVSVIINSAVIAGTVTVTPTLSIRNLATDPWIDYPGVWQVFATNFRYVKIKLDFAAVGGDDLLEILQLNVKLNVKLKNDAGKAIANASDALGTTVNFTAGFLDVESISVTPLSTLPRAATYNFVDVPNPVSFSVFLWDAAGNRVSGDVSWSARGY